MDDTLCGAIVGSLDTDILVVGRGAVLVYANTSA